MADLASITPAGTPDSQQAQPSSLDSIIPATPVLSAGTDTMMAQMNTAEQQAQTAAEDPFVAQPEQPAQQPSATDFTAQSEQNVSQTAQAPENQPVQNTTMTAAPQEPLRHEYIEPHMGPSKAAVFFIALCACATGILLGTVLFAGKTRQPQTIVNGLTGVVKNPDLANQQLSRCGEVDKGRACVLYIMNHTRYDRMADSFFDEAVRLTEVAKYSIAMVNPQYAKTLIRPGQIAEIKIPAQN